MSATRWVMRDHRGTIWRTATAYTREELATYFPSHRPIEPIRDRRRCRICEHIGDAIYKTLRWLTRR